MDPRNSERTPGWTRACSARTELYPIPELLLEATASDLSAAGLSADKRQPAGEGEAGAHRAPEWHRVRHWPAKDWPAHREARGELALKASPDARRALGAECTVQHGVLTLSESICRQAERRKQHGCRGSAGEGPCSGAAASAD